jgi:multidrug efflux system outer membrane protein
MSRTIRRLLACSVIAATACSLAPDYRRPEIPTPDVWEDQTAADGAASPRAAADIPWQEIFTDPRLRDVIELALEHNRDLRIAALNVSRIQAAYRIQRADLMPAIGVRGDGEVYRLPAELSSDGRAETIEQYSVSLGTAGWELDLFGRVQSLKDAAFERYLATESGYRAARIALVAAVAGATMTLAADREALALAESTLAAQEASFELIRQSAEMGVASDLERAQASSQVDAARGEVASYATIVALDRHALEELVGATVPDALVPDHLVGVDALREVEPRTPSEVLLERPDILAAEHQLRAANADIGAARAAFFPRVSLTAGAGTMSDELAKLFGSGTGTWSFIPQITVPIFAGDALRAGLDAAEVDRELAVAEYEKTIQRAFREVRDALALREGLRERLDAQHALVASLDESYRLSELRYEAGIDSYLGVLVTERALDAARQTTVQLRLAEQLNLVDLYKALGGGGVDAAEDKAGAEPAP